MVILIAYCANKELIIFHNKLNIILLIKTIYLREYMVF